MSVTFAGDESGDVSSSFGRGASRFFVVAIVGTSEPDGLRGLLACVRHSAGLAPEFEFSYSGPTSSRLKAQVFASLCDVGLRTWAAVLDKGAVDWKAQKPGGIELYIGVLGAAVRMIPADERETGTLILDEFGSAATVRTRLRRALRMSGAVGFRRLRVSRSRSEDLVQVADLLAGSVYRRCCGLHPGDAEALVCSAATIRELELATK